MNQPNKPQNPDSLHVGETVEEAANKQSKYSSREEVQMVSRASFIRGANWMKDKLSEAAESKWIDVKDRLPETESLLLTTSKKILIGDWYDGIWRISGKNRWAEKIEGGFELLSDLRTGDITHWQPLPSAPNETNVEPRLYTHAELLAFGEKVKELAAENARLVKSASTHLGAVYEVDKESILSIDLNKIEIK